MAFPAPRSACPPRPPRQPGCPAQGQACPAERVRACPLARVLGPRGAPARLGLLEAAFRTPAGRREASGAAGDTGRTQEEPPRPPCRAYRHRVPGEAVFRASGAVGAEGALPLSPPQSLPTRVSAALRGRGSSGSGGVKSKRGLSAGPRPPLLSNPLGGRAGAGGSSVVQTPLTLENAARCPLLSLGPAPWDVRSSVQSPGTPGRGGGLGGRLHPPRPHAGPGAPADRREGRGLGSTPALPRRVCRSCRKAGATSMGRTRRYWLLVVTGVTCFSSRRCKAQS